MASQRQSAPRTSSEPSRRRWRLDGREWENLGRKWKLIKLLHQGATSRLFAARPGLSSPHREARHVVKILRKSATRNRQAIDAISREAEVATQLQDPAFLPLVDSHLTRPPYYIVLPRVHGESLRDVLSRLGRLTIPRALGVVRQVAEALETLHSAGWIHGDLKPDNILVSEDSSERNAGKITLIDLAFARRIGVGTDTSASASDGEDAEPLAGTLEYLPPEALLPQLPLLPSADFYSLGATLYELLTGQPPFAEAMNPQQLLHMHRENRPADVR